jgi:cardiolipin synthase
VIIDRLKAAAARGVRVFLHFDAYASRGVSKQSVQNMKDAGIHVKKFEPLLRSRHFYFGRRLHHKVVVADGIHSLVGGRNVSNDYNDQPGKPGWMDLTVYCEGEASLTIMQICRQLWRNQKSLPPIDNEQLENYYKEIPEGEHTEVRVRRNDWVMSKNQIHKSYLQMFDQAKERITIMCSYFLPGSIYRLKMARAVRRGVKIDVILAGISDVKMAKNAERFLYRWLLKNNIGIYEYQRTVLHAKTATYDYGWVTIGSYNVNNISAHASLELNLDIRDKAFAKLVQQELDDIREKRCKQITPENFAKTNNFFSRLWQRICYVIINNILKLFTFYFTQER